MTGPTPAIHLIDAAETRPLRRAVLRPGQPADRLVSPGDDDRGNGCCLIVKPDRVGRGTGPLLYFNVEGRLRDAVSKVTPAGGAVEEGVIPIGPHGFRAVVTDSEGNRIALHAQTDA